MAREIASFTDLLIRPQQVLHRTNRAEVHSLIQQPRVDLWRCEIEKVVAMQNRQNGGPILVPRVVGDYALAAAALR